MRPQFDVVKKLMTVYIKLSEKEEKLNECGIIVADGFCLFDISNVILDVIGFPPDNTCLFDIDKHLNGISTKPNLRQDFENWFCRDELYDRFDANINVNEFVSALYDEYDSLILKSPHYFVRQ